MTRKVTDDKWNALFDYLFYYGSYLWLPAVVILYRIHERGVIGPVFFGVSIFLIAISFYGRFIEPRWLRVKSHTIDLTEPGYDGPVHNVRVALFSDTHYGIFKNAMPIHRLRQKIEAEKADIVVVAGDLTNHLMVHEIDGAFADFENFKIPVFAVLGNHDFGRPGWLVSSFLEKRLESFGVKLLEGKTAHVTVRGESVGLAGLLDHYTGPADHSVLMSKNGGTPHIVIAHNPDAVLDLPPEASMGIMLSGHTHGGQIRLPRLYKAAIPTAYSFDAGYYETRGHKVFVSSGTGMDVLPVRLFIPPQLDILNLQVAKEPRGEE